MTDTTVFIPSTVTGFSNAFAAALLRNIGQFLADNFTDLNETYGRLQDTEGVNMTITVQCKNSKSGHKLKTTCNYISARNKSTMTDTLVY